jgi:hypothetical protein
VTGLCAGQLIVAESEARSQRRRETGTMSNCSEATSTSSSPTLLPLDLNVGVSGRGHHEIVQIPMIPDKAIASRRTLSRYRLLTMSSLLVRCINIFLHEIVHTSIAEYI